MVDWDIQGGGQIRGAVSAVRVTAQALKLWTLEFNTLF